MIQHSLRLPKALFASMLLVLVLAFADTDVNALAAPSQTPQSMTSAALVPAADPDINSGRANVADDTFQNCNGASSAAAIALDQISCNSGQSPLLIILIAGSLMATVLVLLVTHRDQEMQ